MADAYCVWLYWGVTFFFFQGGWASQAIQRECGSRGHSWWKESDLQHLEEKKPNSASSWVNTQVGKETYLNFHSSSLLQKKVPTRDPWPNQPRAGKPSSWALGMSTEPDCADQKALTSERRNLTTTAKQDFCFLHARDVLLDSHVTFCWLGEQN